MSRLLFVDDDPEIRMVFRRAAERHGFTVLTESDGEAGLRTAIAALPDLVVLDITLPGKDGRDVCRELKARDETSAIPILFVSGRGDEFNRHLCLELGAEDFIEKPFELDALMRKVRHLIKKHAP